MKFFRVFIAVALTMPFIVSPAFASPAGQVNFADLSSQYGEPKVEINLSSALMRMVGSFSKQSDPEVAALLSNLEFITVRVYELTDKTQAAFASIDNVSKQLKRDKWENLVTVNEKDEKVRIFSKSTNDIIDGIVVMVVSPEKNGGEAVFINIVGEIDPAKISKVTDTLDIDLGQ